MEQNPFERLAERMAELFVERFSSMVGSSSRRTVEAVYPQQNLEGSVFNGTNALIASMVSASRGYGIPVWATMNRLNELGLQVMKGEHAIPIINYDRYDVEKETGKRVKGMTDDEYEALLPEDKEKYEKRCYLRFYPEFNIVQTNFAEVYPDQHAELVDFFGFDKRTPADFALLDSVVSEGRWNCPIEVSSNVTEALYQSGSDRIVLPRKEVFVDEHDYYNSLLHAMASSTGSEMRLDRGPVLDKLPGVMGAQASEALVCELAAATAAAAIGFSSELTDSSVGYLRSWIGYIKAEPTLIYKAVTEASRAADMILEGIGFKRSKGLDVSAIMSGVEKAVEARKKAEEKRSQKAAAHSHGKKRCFKGVKTSDKARKIKGSKSL